MNNSIAWAKDQDLRIVRLEVVSENERAIQFYKKYGFNVEGIMRDDHLIAEGQYSDTLVMGLNLRQL